MLSASSCGIVTRLGDRAYQFLQGLDGQCDHSLDPHLAEFEALQATIEMLRIELFELLRHVLDVVRSQVGKSKVDVEGAAQRNGGVSSSAVGRATRRRCLLCRRGGFGREVAYHRVDVGNRQLPAVLHEAQK